MIAHPPFDRLRAFTDGRLSSYRRRRTTAHLAGCLQCRETVGWIRDTRQGARVAMEARAPEGAWERIALRVRAGETVLLPALDDAPARRRPWYRTTAFRAAVLVLGFAGAASAAVPGSPVRSWLGRVLPLESVWEALTTPGPAAPAGDAAGAAPAIALHVALEDDTVAVVLVNADPGVRLRVLQSDAAELEVRATGEAAAARFRTAAGRLAIVDAGPGEISLVLPRAARRITLEVDSRSYLTKEAGQLHLLAPIADTAGTEIILRVRP